MPRILTSAKPLLREHGIEPADVEGTGKDGSVTKGDVERYLERLKAEGEGTGKAATKAKRKKAKAKAPAERKTKGKAKRKAPAGKNGNAPSAASIIKDGLLAGATEEEILEDVAKVRGPDQKVHASWVKFTAGREAERRTRWFRENREALLAGPHADLFKKAKKAKNKAKRSRRSR